MIKKANRNPWAWVPSLYFAEGMPYIIVMTVSVIMYKRLGLSNTDIALYTSWLYLPWVIKPLWSPVVDLFKTKRYWIIAMQLLIGAGLAGVALTIPTKPFIQYTLIFFWLMAFSSATHDIAADGFYMLGLSEYQQSFFVGIRSTFYRFAMLAGQGLLVILAGYFENIYSIKAAWSIVFVILAALFILFFVYHNFILPYPQSDKTRKAISSAKFLEDFGNTFVLFFKRKGILVIIGFLLLYRFSEAQLVKIAAPFLLDSREVGGLALSTSEIGIIYGTIGLIALIIGGILGGIVCAKDGLKKWIWWMLIAINLPNVVYVYMSLTQPESFYIISAFIAVEQFGYGFGFTAYMLYMISISEGAHKTSHYAIATGFMALGMMIPGMFSGWLQETLGYQLFFIWIIVATIPAFLITRYIKIDPAFGIKKNKEMMKTTFAVILIFIVSMVVPTEQLTTNEKPKFSFDKLFPLSEKEIGSVNNKLSSLSLRQKVGQLIFPYANGKDTVLYRKQFARLKNLVENEEVGGILFLAGDIENQTIIINELQKRSKIPLLISADFERGLGMRLENAVEFPYKMAFAAAGNPNYDYKMGKITGREANAIGVHQNYAPILDVVHDYRNPIVNVRSYSSDPDVISVHADAFIRGMHESKVISTAKHFPGHGATDLDSHNELPLIELTKKELWEVDLKTFQFAINAGVKSVMIGHLDVPELTDVEGAPATFSYNVVTRLLKDEMGFDGLVVADALNMHALTNDYTQKQIGVLSLQAGCDVLLFPAEEKEMIDGVVEAVEEGRLPIERINESVTKILKIKKWLELDKNKFVDLSSAKNEINKKSHFRLAQEVAEESITLVKDEQGLIPINPDDYSNVFSITISDSRFKQTIEEPFLFEKVLNEKFSYVKNHSVNFSTGEKDYKKIIEEIDEADLIILPIYANVRSFSGSIELHEDQFNFIRDILKKEKPTVAISFGNPFILSEVPAIQTYLTTYGNVPMSQLSAVNSILGNIPINGKLPIDIPNTEFVFGDGIQKEQSGLFVERERADSNYMFGKVDSLMNSAITQKIFPGAQLVVGHRGRLIYRKNFGAGTYEKNAKAIDDNSIFDLASLTKVTATTSASMLLYDRGKLNLNSKVIEYLPEFDNNDKDKITVKNLLLHNSGLPAWKPFYQEYKTTDEVISAIMEMELDFKPGTKYQYSDLGMITLQKIIEKITGSRIDVFLKENLFDKLKMTNTFYNPSPKVWYNCVPTEKDDYWRMQLMKGKVHDETAYLLGGVAGHAGLFSNGLDLAKLMYLYTNNGKSGTDQIFKKETVDLFTNKSSELSTRALGWDTKSEEKSSAGGLFPMDSFGHTGFTGTSIWVNKTNGLFVILLTNRVHPTRSNTGIIKFRPLIHDAIFQSNNRIN